jgi:hypothetical protein
MIILPTRERFIQDNFFELSFQDRRPDFRIFQSLSSTEQYYLADIYNWDDGTEILNWIIDSEKCDKGTAALIFWRAEPDFYINRTSQTIANYERDVFDLLKKIVSKFNSDSFKRGRLKFDPETKVDEIDWDKVYDEWGKIPTALKYPTKGIVPISLSRIARFIAQWQQRRKYKKREAKRQKRKQKTPHNSG